MKKILAILLAMIMVLSLGMTAWASEAVGEGEDPTEPPAAGEGEGGEAAAAKGSITVKNATKGHTYTAYKVFDATFNGEAVSYTTPAENATKLDASLFGWSTASDADGNITVWVLDGVAEQDVLDWVEANYASFGGTAITGEFDDENSTVTFKDLDFGYYFITSSLGTVVTIDTAAPDAEVYDKNETTPEDPVKTIVSVDGVDQAEVTEANAHVGSTVGFKVTAKTNNWIDKDNIRTEWSMNDKATNMFIDPETIVVKVNGEEISNYTAAGDGNGGFSLTIPMVDEKNNSLYEAPEDGLIPIEITYSAVILETAASAPAKNEIPGDNPPPPNVIYTYAFQIAKTDGTDPLPGAQFELWANGAALTFIDNGDGTYTYSAEGTVTTLDMTENTTIVVKGLDNGWTYTLKEITVPKGYNQAEDITIAGSSLTKVEEITTTADGETTTTVVDTSINSTALFKQEVVNKQGTELPSTGGIGTTIFYVLGGLMAVGAGVVLVTKKRMGKEEL